MRDLRGLEALSSTAGLGLWADDIVLALYRASVDGLTRDDRVALTAAADTLDQAVERTENRLGTPRTPRDIAASNATLAAASYLVRSTMDGTAVDDAAVREILRPVSATLRRAAASKSFHEVGEELDAAIRFFSTVGKDQLVQSNTVSSTRKTVPAWTGTQAISRFF